MAVGAVDAAAGACSEVEFASSDIDAAEVFSLDAVESAVTLSECGTAFNEDAGNTGLGGRVVVNGGGGVVGGGEGVGDTE